MWYKDMWLVSDFIIRKHFGNMFYKNIYKRISEYNIRKHFTVFTRIYIKAFQGERKNRERKRSRIQDL